MQAGKLRHLLTLQQSTDTQNARGEAIENWTDVTTLWAEIEPLSGREGFAAQQMYASATHRIKIRYRAGITAKMRFKKGTRVFDINPPQNPGERNKELIFIATERSL